MVFPLPKIAIGKKIYYLLKSFRIHHWIKNTFLFIPLFFAGEIFNFSKFANVLLGALAFSFVASGIYILNDYFDRKYDKMHPEKAQRPLASGKLSVAVALFGFSLIVSSGFTIAFLLDLKFLIILAIYFLFNISYSFGLKKIAILDVIILSIGFVLRIKAGGALASIYVTEWLNIMVFLLALFMALSKRRDDLIVESKYNNISRPSIDGYNIQFLTTSTTVVLSITLVAYLMYMMSPATQLKFETHRLYYTFLFLIAGVLRYLQIIYLDEKSGSPTLILYKDKFIQICILLWIFSYAFIIYFPNFSIIK